MWSISPNSKVPGKFFLHFQTADLKMVIEIDIPQGIGSHSHKPIFLEMGSIN